MFCAFVCLRDCSFWPLTSKLFIDVWCNLEVHPSVQTTPPQILTLGKTYCFLHHNLRRKGECGSWGKSSSGELVGGEILVENLLVNNSYGMDRCLLLSGGECTFYSCQIWLKCGNVRVNVCVPPIRNTIGDWRQNWLRRKCWVTALRGNHPNSQHHTSAKLSRTLQVRAPYPVAPYSVYKCKEWKWWG